MGSRPVTTDRQFDLFQEDFDFAIRYSAPPEDNLTSIRFFDDSVLPVCTPDFAAEFGLSPGTLVVDPGSIGIHEVVPRVAAVPCSDIS
jgi:DNA-binding transcriptional LysR family regulator